MNGKKEYTFNINEAEVKVAYPEEDIEKIYLPLLKEWTEMQKEKGRRLIVYLAAPPGCGKSALAAFLEYLSYKEDLTRIQALGIDGFHYPQAYLEKHRVLLEGKETDLKQIKGHPLTYDVKKMRDLIRRMKEEDILWPYYSRKIHDPIEDAVRVREKIVLIEGNYLLYGEGEWNDLSLYCDISLFMNMDKDILLKRIIDRKVMTGRTIEEARESVYGSDLRNIELVLEHSREADHQIIFGPDNEVISFR
ncbi:MAG: nucleoside/nucleotide kinase family protein [Erysipelotrichaceae bacterium]|nr:nucleoside/nucleotide kinase family protein [Erysipelotrichaceae bacterium]